MYTDLDGLVWISTYEHGSMRISAEKYTLVFEDTHIVNIDLVHSRVWHCKRLLQTAVVQTCLDLLDTQPLVLLIGMKYNTQVCPVAAWCVSITMRVFRVKRGPEKQFG